LDVLILTAMDSLTLIHFGQPQTVLTHLQTTPPVGRMLTKMDCLTK
jgi:hypothetical protein